MQGLFLFACGWCDGDASKFGGKNTKLGVRGSGVAKRQGEGQGSVQHVEGGILSLALLEMAAHGGNCPGPGAAPRRGPGFQDYVCSLKAVWSRRSTAQISAVGSSSAEPRELTKL